MATVTHPIFHFIAVGVSFLVTIVYFSSILNTLGLFTKYTSDSTKTTFKLEKDTEKDHYQNTINETDVISNVPSSSLFYKGVLPSGLSKVPSDFKVYF